MQQWILRCLTFKKAIFTIALVLFVFCILGFRFVIFDFKLDVMKVGRFAQKTAVITVYDNHLLDSTHLALLAKMQKELSEIKLTQKMTSLYTTPNFRRYLDDNEWHSVLENEYYANDSLERVKSDVLDNELFVGRFINKQADTMFFYLYFSADKYGHIDLEVRDAIQTVLDRYHSNFIRIFQSGSPELVYVLSKKTTLDLFLCIPLLVFLMCTLFGLLFRGMWVSLFPLGIAVYSIACSIGIMGWLSIPVSEFFLLAIGLSLAITVASNTHMIYAYQEGVRHFPGVNKQEHLSFMLKKVLLPLLLAAFAALLGFLLDLFSSVQILKNLTYAFAFCLIFSTLVTVFVVPLLISMISLPKPKERRFFNKIITFFLKLNDFFTLNAWKMAIILLMLSALGFYCAKSLTIESLPFSFFKKNDPFMENLYFSSRQVSGQNVLKIEIFSKEKNIFLKPEYLQKILNEEKKFLRIPNTSYIYSVADVIASTNKIFLFNEKKFFKIPENPAMLKRYYNELSKQDFMSSLINKDFNELSIFVSYSIYSSGLAQKYKENIQSLLKETLKGTSLHFKTKDYWAEYAQIIDGLLILQIYSIGAIYLICFFVVGIMFRSVKAGLISIVPNIMPLCVIAVTQYTLGIPITLISVILYSIVVGLSIDETAHIFYTFKQELMKSKNKQSAVTAALRSQIIPVTIASVTIALACAALLSSQFLPVIQLSFLMSVGVLSTWVSGLVITPFLMQKIDVTKNIKGKHLCSIL